MARKPSPKKPKPDFITSLEPRTQHIVALLFLLILPFIVYYGPTLGGQQYFAHDTLQWRAGAETIIEHRQETGEEPLWAENMFSGMPAYFVSYAKSVPHFDTVISWTNALAPAVEYWILMGGLYLMFILLKARPLPAALGTVFIAFTTYIPIIIGAGHNTKFAAFAYIPWMFVGYLMLTRTDKKMLSFFVFASAVLLEIRANHPQVTYYFLYLMAIWWIFDGIKLFQKNQLKKWGQQTALLTGGGVVALLGNLQPLWSRLEYSPFSIRGGSAIAETATSGGLDLEYAFAWSQGWGELLTLLIPNLFGGASPDYWGPKSVTSGPHYLGAVAFLLFLYGFILSKRREKFIFLTSGSLSMLFSLGYHFPLLNEFMFRFMPLFDKFRAPEMWLMVTVFSFSVIAVFGVEALIGELFEWKQKNRDSKLIYYPVIGGLIIGLAFTLSSESFLDYEKPGERRQIAQYLAQQNNVSVNNRQVQQRASQYINSQMKPKRKKMAEDDAFRFTLLLAFSGVLIIALYHRKISAGYALAGLLLIGTFDMLNVAERYDNEESLTSATINKERLLQQRERSLDTFIKKRIDSGNNYPYRVYPRINNPFNNATMSYFYPSLGGYSGAKLSIYQDMIERHISQANPEVLNMLNVKYMSSRRPQSDAQWKTVYQGNDGIVLENKDVQPKAFFVDSLVTASSEKEAIEMLDPQQGFDASEVAILEQEPAYQPRNDTTASVSVTSYGPREIGLEYNRQHEGFLVLSEIYYPAGWQAYIDGEEASIYKTNYLLRGIFVPEGEHEVSFRFNPVSHIWGKRIAWAGNIGLWLIGIWAVFGYYRSRPETDENNES